MHRINGGTNSLTARLYSETSERFSTKREADEPPNRPPGRSGDDPRRAKPAAALPPYGSQKDEKGVRGTQV
jgi:hypothetical protein